MTDDEQQDGQVSEVSGLTNAGQEAPGDSVAGAPDQESGRPDEGPTGPNAVTFGDDEHRDDGHRDKDKSDVETTG